MIKYVIHSDGRKPIEMFAKTTEEAMEAFDRITMMCNHDNNFEDDSKYLTCKEMGIYTTEDFEQGVVGLTDYIFCDTFEDYVKSINEFYKNEWDTFSNP